MSVLFASLFTLLMLAIVGCAAASLMGFPWLGLGVPVLLALAVLVEFLERRYNKAAGIPTLFERAMQLKNEDTSSSAAPEK